MKIRFYSTDSILMGLFTQMPPKLSLLWPLMLKCKWKYPENGHNHEAQPSRGTKRRNFLDGLCPTSFVCGRAHRSSTRSTGIRAVTSENVPSAMCAYAELSLRWTHTHAHSHSLIRNLIGLSLDSQGCNCSSYWQQRFWSDCTVAQADLSLRWTHMSEGIFPDVEANLDSVCSRVPNFVSS